MNLTNKHHYKYLCQIHFCIFFFILQIQEWIEKFNVDICLLFREQGQTKIHTYGEIGLNALIQGEIYVYSVILCQAVRDWLE